MNFSEALQALKDGKKVRRSDWSELNGIKDALELWENNILYIEECGMSNREVWFESDDVLAEDWEIVE